MLEPRVIRADAVAVIVLRGVGRSTRILLLRRERGAFAGAWTFVMGGIEAGERATAAARRELCEETGLVAPDWYTAGELDAFYDPVADRIVHVPFFVARIADSDPPIVLEDAVHDAYRWATFAEAQEALAFAAQRRVLDEVRRAFVVRRPDAWRTIA